jgi:hypothetical protein
MLKEVISKVFGDKSSKQEIHKDYPISEYADMVVQDVIDNIYENIMGNTSTGKAVCSYESTWGNDDATEIVRKLSVIANGVCFFLYKQTFKDGREGKYYVESDKFHIPPFSKEQAISIYDAVQDVVRKQSLEKERNDMVDILCRLKHGEHR